MDQLEPKALPCISLRPDPMPGTLFHLLIVYGRLSQDELILLALGKIRTGLARWHLAVRGTTGRSART